MKYKVIRTIDHDCIRYKVDDAIELSINEAQPLLECKAIEPLNKPFARSNAEPGKGAPGDV